MTHLLPKHEYGLLTLVVTVGELVDSSLSTWVRLALMRLGGGGMISRGLANVVFSTVAGTTAIGGVISLGIAIVLVPDRAVEFWVAVFAYILAISLLKYGLALLQVAGRSVTYSVLEILRALTSFAGAVAIAAMTGTTFLLPSLTVAAFTALFAGVAVRASYRDLRAGERAYRYADVMSFAGPLLILSVLTIVAGAIDRLTLQYSWGATAVGAYAAIYALARQPIDVLANALNAGGYPALVGRYETGGRSAASEFLSHQLGFFLKFVVPPACVLVLVQHDLAAALLPRSYAAHTGEIFALITIAALAFNLRSVIFDNVFLVERRNMLQLRYFVIVFAIGLAAAAIGVPRLGILGAALVFVTWTILALTMSILFGQHLVRVSFPWAEAARAAILAGASCVAVALVQLALAGQTPFLRLATESVAACGAYAASLAGLHPAGLTQLLKRRGSRPA